MNHPRFRLTIAAVVNVGLACGVGLCASSNAGEPEPSQETAPETAPAAAKGSAPSQVSEVIEQVERANRDLQSWSASYEQRRHYVHFDHSETRKGRMQFKRGTGFRIDATEPEEAIVVRSEKAVQWRPRTQQLHVYKFSKSSGGRSAVPIPLPIGDGDWSPESDHDVRILDSTDSELVVELIPHDDSATYQKKTVWFDRESWLPVKLQLVESTDDEVHFSFTEVEKNGEISDSVFELEPPKGAEVIEHADLPELTP